MTNSIFAKKRFQKKNVAEGQIVTELTDPRCQKQTSKNDFRTSICNGIKGFLKHFFAAQVPGPPGTAPSASHPIALRMKDCPGLGYPNTLKLHEDKRF